MKVAIMQPYFLPYIGYFQLIAAADAFVVYDTIKYTKKGWINRNRLLANGGDALFSLPLKHAPDTLDVVERQLAGSFDRARLLNQFRGAYARAPYFDSTYAVLERIVRHDDDNLFRFILHAIVSVCAHLGLTTEIRIASDVAADHTLRGQDRVIAICRALGADCYLNPIGGTTLYASDNFRAHGLALKFVRSRPLQYAQFGDRFVPWLSIVDVMMFNPPHAIASGFLHDFDLI